MMWVPTARHRGWKCDGLRFRYASSHRWRARALSHGCAPVYDHAPACGPLRWRKYPD